MIAATRRVAQTAQQYECNCIETIDGAYTSASATACDCEIHDDCPKLFRGSRKVPLGVGLTACVRVEYFLGKYDCHLAQNDAIKNVFDLPLSALCGFGAGMRGYGGGGVASDGDG